MLKIDFNNEIKKLGNNTRIGEVKLFTCLEKALKNYHNITTHICHQKYVKTCFKRELCDLFVMIIHRDYLRYSFVQHKFSRNKNYNGLCNFSIDCGQHRILVEKPLFQIVGKSYISDILSTSKYDTITAYSVFYKDSNGDFDFDFASANSVECQNGNNFVTKIKCGKKAIHKYSSLNYNNKNREIDYDSLAEISEIEKYPEFGEVFYFCNNKISVYEKVRLMRFISQFDLGKDARKTLQKYNLNIIDEDRNFFNDEFSIRNDENNIIVQEPFYVRKMLIIDLNEKLVDKCKQETN